MDDKGGLDMNSLLSAAKLLQGKNLSEDEQARLLRETVLNRMNQSQSEQLNKILGDADAVDNLMQSEQAQRILKKFGKK